MGFYLNYASNGRKLPNEGKAKALIIDGAILLPGEPKEFVDNLVCVVDNGTWDAAAYVYDEKEFNRFREDRSGREKVWLTHPKAKELSGYK